MRACCTCGTALLRVREHTFDMRRLRGGTLREPLPVRAMRGCAAGRGDDRREGEGESSVLLPPCPRATAQTVLAEIVESRDVVTGALRRHGPAAARRRWTRALAVPAVLAAALVVLDADRRIAVMGVVGVGRW